MTKEKELYDLYTIREFYKEFIGTNTIPQQTKKKMFLYGGTVPYILGYARKGRREFNDVDMYVDYKYMSLVRNTLQDNPHFQMISDSEELTSKIYEPGLYDEDFGLKGTLFGIPISIIPIYNEYNNLYGMSFDEEDFVYLFNTIILRNTQIKSFTQTVDLYGGSIRIVPLEYTYLTKLSAIENCPLRGEKDKIDLEYIEKHFRLNQNVLEDFQRNLPKPSDRIIKVRRLIPTQQSFKTEDCTKEYKYENGIIRSYHGS